MWINKIIYLAITIYSAILALLYYGVVTFYSFLFLLACPFLLLGILLYTKNKVQVKLKGELSVANINQPVLCTAYISNNSIFPVGCIRIIVGYQNQYGREQGSQHFTISMNGNSKQSINFTIKSEHVGNISVSVEQVRVYDYLRIFSRKVPCTSKLEVNIIPEIHTIEASVFAKQPDFIDSDTFSKIKSGDDPSEVFDIREYKEGDKLHRINWKLSSKKESVLVKEYSLPVACTTAILVDFEIPDALDHYEYMDALLTSVNSISYSLLLQEHSHYIAWYEQEKENYNIIDIRDMEEMYLATSHLLSVTPCHGANNLLEAHEVFAGHQQLTKVFYITWKVDERKYEQIERQFGQAQVEVIEIVPEQKLAHTVLKEEGIRDERIQYQYVSMANIQTSIEALIL